MKRPTRQPIEETPVARGHGLSEPAAAEKSRGSDLSWMQQALGNRVLRQRASSCPSFSTCPTGGACHPCPRRVADEGSVGPSPAESPALPTEAPAGGHVAMRDETSSSVESPSPHSAPVPVRPFPPLQAPANPASGSVEPPTPEATGDRPATPTPGEVETPPVSSERRISLESAAPPARPGDSGSASRDSVIREPLAAAAVSADATSASLNLEPAPRGVTARMSSGTAVIANDSASAVRVGQMRKSEFLSELRTAVTATAEKTLAGTGRSATDCPYIASWFGYYAGRSAQYVERAIHKYAPQTSMATTAEQYISIIREHVRGAVERWAMTGRITGVPEGVPLNPPASTPGDSADAAYAGDGDASPRPELEDPERTQLRLGSGNALDGAVRTRMEAVFGSDFSRVRVHTNAEAGELARGFDARAFTLGEHVAFGSATYRPGTPMGDALIAHELAHVIQQRGNGGAPAGGGRADESALEEDADRAVMGAVAARNSGSRRLLGVTRTALPRLRSGLRISRCKKEAEPTPTPSTDGCVTGNLTAATSGAFQGGWDANSYLSGVSWGDVVSPGTAGRDRRGFKVQMTAPYTGSENLGVSQNLTFSGANEHWLNSAADYFGQPHGSMVNGTTYDEPVLDASDPFATRPWFLRYKDGIASFADVPRGRPGDKGSVDFVTSFYSRGTACTHRKCSVTWRWTIDFTPPNDVNTVTQQSQSCT